MTDRLAGVLAESRRLGFLGPGPVARHLEHAEAFAEALSVEPARALDLGAGGGLPGLVLAATTWPSTRWTFLDAMARRTAFLSWAVGELDLAERVTVITERAEVAAHLPSHRSAYGLVTARSFGPPGVAAECAVGFLAIGGALVVSEPPTGLQEERWPATGLAELGLAVGMPLVASGNVPTHLIKFVKVEETSPRFPRRTGIPGKRPLF
ncbi:MAG: class I SAM-dependent methyltransferase [Acidimicrobiia bacterium]|nr:class I SAM-dependent methyltransferase [Acidimicrobiia bacterium]